MGSGNSSISLSAAAKETGEPQNSAQGVDTVSSLFKKKRISQTRTPHYLDDLPELCVGDDVVALIRMQDPQPWATVAPPEVDNPDDEVSAAGSTITDPNSQFTTHWCRHHKSWSVVVEESDQPVRPITGGYKGAYKASKRASWSMELSKPLIARCPGGTTNPVM